jgi:hypothetical protein
MTIKWINSKSFAVILPKQLKQIIYMMPKILGASCILVSSSYTFGVTTVAALTTRLQNERLAEQTLRADGVEAKPLFAKATAATSALESWTDDILLAEQQIPVDGDGQELSRM